MGYPVRIEIENNGLLVWLGNHYSNLLNFLLLIFKAV